MVLSSPSEKQLLWHPRRANKFVVGGGSQIALYEWDSERSEIRHVTSQQDLQSMKCFAWSSEPLLDDLVAVGQASGRVDLLRLEARRYARDNVLSSGPIVSLPVRTSRSCHALTFCNIDPSYLAAGLDKVRTDPSLIIWDIQTALPVLSIPGSQSALPSDEQVTPSFRSAIARPGPRIPRAEASSRADTRILQQHAPSEGVSALAFLPASTQLLLAGISNRWLRLFDLRGPASSPTMQAAAKVQGIATDPLNPQYFASYGDSTVTVWDVRRLSTSLLTFSEKDASADGARQKPNGSLIANIDFSSTRRGMLAVLERDRSYVRFWDLIQSSVTSFDGSYSDTDGDKVKDSPQSRVPKRSWTNLPWSTPAHNAKQSPTESQDAPSTLVSGFVLADTRKTRIFSRPLLSFGLVPSSKNHPLTTNVMTVNTEGDLELYAIHDTPKQACWSSQGDLIIGAGVSCKVIRGFQDSAPIIEPWDVQNASQPQQIGSNAEWEQQDELSVRGPEAVVNDVSAPGPPLFGRGDEDGFPALAVKKPATLSLPRLGKSRTFSPASFRHYQFEHAGAVTNDARQPGPGSFDRLASSHVRGQSRLGEKASSKTRRLKARSVSHIIQQDISMIIRRRVIQGYSISNPQHNIWVTQDDTPVETTLSDLWAWIHHSDELLSVPTSRLHGYDFSLQGLLGIWEGFPPLHQLSDSTSSGLTLSDLSHSSSYGLGLEHDHLQPQPSLIAATLSKYTKQRSRSPIDDLRAQFHAAIAALCSRTWMQRSNWKPLVSTNKLEQRQLALSLLGWSLREEDLNGAVRKWEKEDKHSRAACWLVFTSQYSKAIDILMRSKDDLHHMISGLVAGLMPQGKGSTSRSTELVNHCERLILRLQDPYLRAMLTQLTSRDWSEVLEEEALPLRERLAIAFQFYDDSDLSIYLQQLTKKAAERGDIEGIIVTGLTPAGMKILSSYVDLTGDVQTAAILSSYVCPSRFEDARSARWLEAYRDLLDGFKLFHHRVSFDIERGQILQEAVQNGDLAPFEWAPRQIFIRCNYCSKSVNPPNLTVSQPTVCPHCGRALPRCSICLLTLSIVPDVIRDAELSQSISQPKDTIEDAFVVCQNCRHGGHASHIMEWFFGVDGKRSDRICPVVDCECRCADDF